MRSIKLNKRFIGYIFLGFSFISFLVMLFVGQKNIIETTSLICLFLGLVFVNLTETVSKKCKAALLFCGLAVMLIAAIVEFLTL